MRRAALAIIIATCLVAIQALCLLDSDDAEEKVPIGLVAIPIAQEGLDASDFSVLSPDCNFFIENVGQLKGSTEVLFYSKGGSLTVGLAPNKIVFISSSLPAREEQGPRPSVSGPAISTSFAIEFEGANDILPVGVHPLNQRVSYLVGSDPAAWRRDVRSFAEVLYKGLYDGIDLRFYFKEGRFKYDFILSAGADPGAILLRYWNVEGLELDPLTGDLLIDTGLGPLRDARPTLLQEEQGGESATPGDFRLLGERSLGFLVPDGSLRSSPLIIDPGIEFSTFLGGIYDDQPWNIERDALGNIFVIGQSTSSDFPTTPGAYNRSGYAWLTAYSDVVVAKLDPTGSRLLFSTFIGGKADESAYDIKVNPNGDAYITGWTRSTDFPTTDDALYRIHNGYFDAYLLKLSEDGSTLKYSTFLGGNGDDWSCNILLGKDGCVYVSGFSSSTDFPTTRGAYCTTLTPSLATWTGDNFVTKFDRSLSIVYSTFIGGNGYELLYDTTLDDRGALVLGGYTTSDPMLPSTGGLCPDYLGGATDGFVLTLSPDGSTVEHWTYLGGYLEDHVTGVSVLPDDTIYVVGATQSPDLPVTMDALQADHHGGWDIFVMVLGSDLEKLDYSTFFGGARDDWPDRQSPIRASTGTMLNIGGWTESSDFPTTEGCYDATFRGREPEYNNDGYVAVFNMSGRTLSYSTYIGGENPHAITSLEVDGNGSLYLTMYTDSSDIPITEGAYCATHYENYADILVMKFDPSPCDRPEAVTGLMVEMGDGCLTVQWDPTEEFQYRVQRYVVYRGDTPGTMTKLKELDPKTSRWIDQSVVNGIWYYYGVAAVNSAGEGDHLAVRARALALPSAPGKPAFATGDGTVELIWDPPLAPGGELLGYRIFRGRTSDFLTMIEPNCTAPHFIDRTVQPGRTYYYSVGAFNTRGDGAMSMILSVKATAPPAPPSDPWVAPGDGNARLYWGPSPDDGGVDVTGFRVYRGSTLRDFVLRRECPAQTFSYLDTGCTNGRQYYYYVTSFSDVGESAPSLTLPVVPFGPPSSPRFVVAQSGDGQAALSWSAPSDMNGRPVTGYKVYYGEMPSSLIFSETIGNKTNFLHVGATNGIKYYYEVAAINEAGEGSVRSETVEAMPMGLPGRPTGLTAGYLIDNILLKWRSPADTGGAESLDFRVYRGGSPEALDLVAELKDCEEFCDSAVEAGMIYYYSVAAANVIGEGAPSMTVMGVLVTEPGHVVDVRIVAGDGYILLTWSPPAADGGAPVKGFDLYKGSQEDSLRRLATSWALQYLNDTDVENGNTYFYRIQAANVVGPGPLSDIVSATPTGPPGRAEGLDARVDSGSIILVWAAPTATGRAPVHGYVVMRGLSPGELAPIAYAEGVMTFVDTALERGTTYYYCVVANSSLGSGPASQIVRVAMEPLRERARSPSGYYLAAALLACAVLGVFVWRRAHPEGTGLEVGEVEESAATSPPAADVTPDAEERPSYIVEKVFAIYQDGRLIVDAERQDGSKKDAEIMSGLLVAIQGIVQYGLKGIGTLESVKFGDNLILIASGKRINLAAVIYGSPGQELVERLQSTVRQIEDHYSAILETWSGDQAEFLAAMALIAPLVESTEHLTRESMDGITAVRDVSLLSAVDFHRGYVRLKLAVFNTTDEQIVDAAIEIRYDPDMLRVERVEPARFRLKGDRVIIGRIEPGANQTLAILMDPQICQGTHIDGTFTYYDVGGSYHRKDMKRCHADVVCPLFFTRKNANTAMLRRLIKERLKATEFRVFRYPDTMAPSEMLAVGKNAIGGNDVQLVREYVVGGPPFEAEAWYYGETKVKDYKIVMRLGVIDDKHAVEFFAASTAMEPITGLLADFKRNLAQLMRERFSKGLILELERDEQLRIDLERRQLLIDRDEGDIPVGTRPLERATEEPSGSEESEPPQ